jgi:hypothetical protein
MVRRIRGGALGKIIPAKRITGPHTSTAPLANASPVERRLRNWVHDGLSGDIVVEQNIHAIDICNWVLDSHPQKPSPAVDAKRPPKATIATATSTLFSFIPAMSPSI